MELPYAGALGEGFNFRGRKVPFLNNQKGIYRGEVITIMGALADINVK
jgi:hypothetical protein